MRATSEGLLYFAKVSIKRYLFSAWKVKCSYVEGEFESIMCPEKNAEHSMDYVLKFHEYIKNLYIMENILEND